jgi:hypothetical protein
MNEIEICLLTQIIESCYGKTSQQYIIYVHTSFMFVVCRFSKIWKRLEFSHLGLGNLDHDGGIETQTYSIWIYMTPNVPRCLVNRRKSVPRRSSFGITTRISSNIGKIWFI